MSDRRDDEAVILEAFPKLREDDHHSRCNTHRGDPCDCYARRYLPARAALASLSLRLQNAETALYEALGALRPIPAKCDFSLHVGTEAQMRSDLEYLKRWSTDALAALASSAEREPETALAERDRDTDGTDPGTPGERLCGTAVPAPTSRSANVVAEREPESETA